MRIVTTMMLTLALLLGACSTTDKDDMYCSEHTAWNSDKVVEVCYGERKQYPTVTTTTVDDGKCDYSCVVSHDQRREHNRQHDRMMEG